MKTPGRQTIITYTDATKNGAKGLLALTLLALLVLTPACQSNTRVPPEDDNSEITSTKPPKVVDVYMYCIDEDSDDSTLPVLHFEPDDPIRVSRGDFIVFIAEIKKVELQFPSIIADLPKLSTNEKYTEHLVLKGSGPRKVISAWFRIKDDAPKSSITEHLFLIPKTEGPECILEGHSDHPPIIVNGT